MKQYNLLNRLVGWLVFLISAVTYILTTEDTASFWDCGEFISTSNKLLVGHPPGAPFFMIVGRLFAIFAPGASLVAKSINIMSALASAFTILFLFWTITALAKKIFVEVGKEIENWRTWAIMGAGAVGALAYTFSDTFWFSAVEGEVYAMSSLFTAVVFWAILEWEEVADQPRANRWIVLIAYLMGLSIGVHLLNLLCIPAIVMVYYYKKFTITNRNTLYALLLSCVLIVVILYGIIPGVVKFASYFELFFVNEVGFGYNTGAVIYALLLISAIVWGIWYTYKNKHEICNLAITSLAVIILGYSSFAMIVIRSVANPTMDQNSPEDVFSLMDYLNREQYGDRPLFIGQHFNSPKDKDAIAADKGKPVYMQKDGKYVVTEYRPSMKYTDNVLFPRMYSSIDEHVSEYKSWSDFEGKPVNVRDEDGQMTTIMRPTFGENLRFFLSYQVNFMYWRYFMWNFAGRQNDIMGRGELTHGNWLSGISFIDNARLGDQDLLPDHLRNNKGHNVYFMLPLILGLIGMFFQMGRGDAGRQGFYIVMLLFFMTGLAIVIYLNQTPLQPRERDYAYAGSFYAFAIWIGLGVLAVVEALRKYCKAPDAVAAIGATVISLVAVPGIMAQQNWDDHDRSGCTIARDIAYNYLNSCDENAVIFTNGDNDTFPLWYAQEVEGIRTDVRVCNLSYLSTPWYCDQMKRKAYESAPLPIRFTHDQYTGDRDVIYFIDRFKELELNKALAFVASDDPQSKKLGNLVDKINYIPSKKLIMPVDSNKVLANGVVSSDYRSQIASELKINVSNQAVYKNALMVYDMLNNANWERPLYYAVTVGPENFFGLNHYFQLEGLAYRISPVYTGNGSGRVDTEKMYDKVMNKFRWGFYNKPGIYLDENKMRMASTWRNSMARLAGELAKEAKANNDSAKHIKALNVLNKIKEEFPDNVIPHTYYSLEIARSYYLAGDLEGGDDILRKISMPNWQEFNFYMNLDNSMIYASIDGVQHSAAIYSEVMKVVNQYNRVDLADEINAQYDPLFAKAERLFR